MKNTFSILLTATLALAACADSQEVVPREVFQEPDVQADFCGTQIDTTYCNCAFAKEDCASLNMTAAEANVKVAQEYGTYVAELLKKFAAECAQKNGVVEHKTCYRQAE